MELAEKKRIYKFDNIKWLCILLVLIGHFIEPYTGKVTTLKSVFFLIYSFHMPLFLFVSGLFQKRYDKNSRIEIQKILFFFVLYLALKAYVFAEKVLLGQSAKYRIFYDAGAPWFMLALAFYLLVIFLVKRVHPAIVMSCALVISCICGYFSWINDYMCFSRLLVFMPFYLAGYYLTPDQVMNFTRKNYVRIPAWVLTVGFFIFCLWKIKLVDVLGRLFSGRHPFENAFDGCNVLHRLLCIVISIIISIAVISAVPDIRIPAITGWGKNTLAVYFWHRVIENALLYSGANAAIIAAIPSKKVWGSVIILTAAATCVLLSFNIFSIPLTKLKKALSCLKPIVCYCVLAGLIGIGLAYSFIIYF